MSVQSLTRWLIVSLAAVEGLAATSPRSLPAQDRPPRAIESKPLEFASPFSEISQLVELADGRLLVHDAIERKLGLIDLRTGRMSEVARQGSGPLEYRSLAALLRVPGDSVLLWDWANSRVLLLAPDGKPVGTRPLADRGLRSGALVGFMPREADATGSWYGGRRQVTMGDSTAIVRIVPSSGRQDTLVMFATPQLRPKRSAENRITVLSPGLPPRGAWGVFADGRALVIHGGTYTPEIIMANGARVTAPPVPFPRIPVTDQDRARHLRDVGQQFQRMILREAGAAGREKLPRVEVEPPEAWPTHKPPILSDVVRVDSRRRAWVHVVDRNADAGERYDLLDADGRRVDAVRMPKGVRLVGMGNGVLYGAREDDDGLLWLQQYRLP